MALPQSDIFKVHVQNLRAVSRACDALDIDLRRSLATNRNFASEALLKTSVLLVGAWAEVRLCKLLYEPKGFSDAERAQVLAEGTQLDRWKQTLELGFRRRYGVPTAKLTKNSLPVTAFSRFAELTEVIATDLAPIIEVRNRLAHGQWARTLTNDGTNYSPETMKLLNTENALSLRFKRTMIECLSQLVHNLVASVAFERDFDKHYRVLHQARVNLVSRSYEDWLEALCNKRRRYPRISKAHP